MSFIDSANIDLWKLHAEHKWICITTNSFIKRTGELVMGKGTALRAKMLYPDLPLILGYKIKRKGNVCLVCLEKRIITFPTKHAWFEPANVVLIEQSCQQLVKIWDFLNLNENQGDCYLPRPGCGNGKLDYESQVKPILEKYLDSRFIVISK